MSESRPLNPQGMPQLAPQQPHIAPPPQRPTITPIGQPGPAKIAPIPPMPQKSPDSDPIRVEDGSAGSTMSKIKLSAAVAHASHTYKRQPNANGQGAIRVRTFHGRLSEEGMSFLDDKINEFLDAHPEVEVKFATTTIGQFEGKIRELALVVNVWY